MLRSNAGTLAQLTRDLTAAARQGQLEPVRCREDEISRVIDILLRHGKNNPALVGPAGVGKTAIAEGLAQRIARGSVPIALRSTRVLALDHVALLAGTMYRGQYEERLRALVDQASRDPDVVLFVDELHNLIGQGTAVGVAMDAANMLKPALVRGDFRVIGATTDDEYERWVCGDPALERRFQKIAVRELSAEQTLEVLEARKDRLERHHNVAIADEALRAAIRLTDLFITDRARPDRAIDALDEACAHAQAGAIYTPATEALILQRRELRRQRAQNADEAEEVLEMPREQGSQASEESSRSAASGAGADDTLDRFARDSIAALERFGAEIEAALSGQSPDAAQASKRSAHGPSGSTESPRPLDAGARLVALELELNRRLIEEGLVVRGHDVARVVSLASGQMIQWTE